MLREQKQRILGYFIEEARDHLHTIEQGLLNLHNVIAEPEMVNELFRAAHSLKGGAAMLELNSIQQTAHHLENYFKVFQEYPQIQIDQKLASLFLRVFDTLQELLEQLNGSLSLSENVVNPLMSEVEPVFAALEQHLEWLKQAGGAASISIDNLFDEAPTPPSQASVEPDLSDLFGELFDTTAESQENHHILEVSTQPTIIEDAEFTELWQDERAPQLKEQFEPVEMPIVAEAVDDNSVADFQDIFFQLEESLPATDIVELGNEAPTFDLDEIEDFADLDALLGGEAPSVTPADEAAEEEFAQLSALLELDSPAVVSVDEDDEFAQLSALLELDSPAVVSVDEDDEFSELEDLLDTDEIAAEAQAAPPVEAQKKNPTQNIPRPTAFERTMRVPVKHLDNVSNLVGELVVYRNSLEQDQQRQRQFLDNLLHQVQQLSNVGARMQELYERSLLEASLLNSCQGVYQSALSSTTAAASDSHATGIDFDALEMDRFTSFHSLSQEIIELIVRVRESSSDIEFITDETQQVARQFRQVTTQLQEGLTRSRMVPFAQIADRLPRAVRDIALKYGKQAELHIEGRDTLIDKVILEQLYDPMTHLVNNAITHGIETPEQRSLSGKSPVGQITIQTFHQGNQTVISVTDDGGGIDSEQVKAKAQKLGLIAPAQAKTMSRIDAYNLLFHPGFSTKDKVDEFAGRGVGMDVVRTSLSEIGGVINTDSTLGKGTTFTIRLPLSLSICKALCCLSDKARIAFPMDGVEDMMDLPSADVQLNTAGLSCIPWRDSLLPFRPLKELLTYNRQLSRGNVYGGNREDEMISIVVIRSAGTLLALQVDQVLGEQEIVIKQFEGPAPKPIGVAGATVLGDGRIMPIADVLELIDLSMGKLQRQDIGMWNQGAATVLPETPASVKTDPTVLIVDDSITVRELLSLTFNKAGYRVEQARDGQEAWDKLRDGLPCDIVFCDIEMPRMDGLELLSRIHNEPSLSHLPIAMLTSRGADRHRQMAVKLGASGYFTKPYLEEALLDGAERMLKGEVLIAMSSSS